MHSFIRLSTPPPAAAPPQCALLIGPLPAGHPAAAWSRMYCATARISSSVRRAGLWTVCVSVEGLRGGEVGGQDRGREGQRMFPLSRRQSWSNTGQIQGKYWSSTGQSRLLRRNTLPEAHEWDAGSVIGDSCSKGATESKGTDM
jgi:hypothetical protein